MHSHDSIQLYLQNSFVIYQLPLPTVSFIWHLLEAKQRLTKVDEIRILNTLPKKWWAPQVPALGLKVWEIDTSVPILLLAAAQKYQVYY